MEGHGIMDAHAWVAVAFVIFMGLAAKFVFPRIVRILDARSSKISSEIEEAQQLKEEAENLFADAGRKFKEAQKSAKEMIENAKKEAQLIAANSAVELEEEIARKISLSEQKITRAEIEAIVKIKRQAAELAAEAAKEAVAQVLSKGKTKDALIAKSARAIVRIA